MSNILENGSSFWHFVCRDIFSEEFALSECLPARPNNPHKVLVELANLNDYASSVPFVRVWAGLVLDPHSVADLWVGSVF